MMIWPFKRKERYPEIKDNLDKKLRQSAEERDELDRRLSIIHRELVIIRRGR